MRIKDIGTPRGGSIQLPIRTGRNFVVDQINQTHRQLLLTSYPVVESVGSGIEISFKRVFGAKVRSSMLNLVLDAPLPTVVDEILTNHPGVFESRPNSKIYGVQSERFSGFVIAEAAFYCITLARDSNPTPLQDEELTQEEYEIPGLLAIEARK